MYNYDPVMPLNNTYLMLRSQIGKNTNNIINFLYGKKMVK